MDEASRVRETALRLLARRDHSAGELKRKLTLRGFSADSCEEVVEWLMAKGYVNDRRFAEQWAESALSSGRCFGARLKHELQQRGISADLAAEVNAQCMSGTDEASAVRGLIERKFPGIDPMSIDIREKRRVIGFLQRRGFSISAIMSFFRNQIPLE